MVTCVISVMGTEDDNLHVAAAKAKNASFMGLIQKHRVHWSILEREEL